MSNAVAARVKRAKINGIHYTPTTIAEMLVEGVHLKSGDIVLDPACGEGALLLAAKRTAERKGIVLGDLFAFDRLSQASLKSVLPSCRFLRADFLKETVKCRPRVILMNPPFVRPRALPIGRVRSYQELDLPFRVTLAADLWVTFLAKAAALLGLGGEIGAILPWSFLQSDYAISCRRWLSEHFEECEFRILPRRQFDSTNQRTCLVWLRGKRDTAVRARIHGTVGLRPSKPVEVTDAAWSSNLCFAYMTGVACEIEQLKTRFGWTRFGDHMHVRIGIVTGSNGVFVLKKDDPRVKALPTTSLVPILTKVGQVKYLVSRDVDADEYLVWVPSPIPEGLKAFVSRARALKVHKSSHALRRDPWFQVELGDIPHAFFPYRVTSTSLLSMNRGALRSTNSIHNIWFTSDDANARGWMQLSLLSAFGQLSLECRSRVYGAGMLKVEPSALAAALVWVDRQVSCADALRSVSQLLQVGNLEGAQVVATRSIALAAGVPFDLTNRVLSLLRELRSLRS